MARKWECVMGLEIHCQLSTEQKLFCNCKNQDSKIPNEHVCPICLGYPGALPKLNWEAVELAIKAATALGCQIRPISEFSRKHYFYPDLPKGYQITQFDQPLAEHGQVPIGAPVVDGFEQAVTVKRVHLEEDSAKNTHLKDGSAVNFNRASVPLIEIVSDPFVGKPDHAAQYLRHVHWLLLEARVTHGNLEDGHLRCDVNVSVRPQGESTLRTRVEVKNLNSFRNIERAIQYERERQIKLYESGQEPSQETRLFDDKSGQTLVLRSKEEAMDYRYFPEPDLPLMQLTPDWIAKFKCCPTVLEKKRRLMLEWGANEGQAVTLLSDPSLADLAVETVGLGASPRKTLDWVLTVVLEHKKGHQNPISPHQLFELIDLVSQHRINLLTAKDVFRAVMYSDASPQSVVAAQGLEMDRNEDTVRALIEKVAASHPNEWKRFRDGDRKLMGFFMGQVMKQAKVDPKQVSKMIIKMSEEIS